MDIAAVASGVGCMNGPIDGIAFSGELLPDKIPRQKDILFQRQFMWQGNIDVMGQKRFSRAGRSVLPCFQPSP